MSFSTPNLEQKLGYWKGKLVSAPATLDFPLDHQRLGALTSDAVYSVSLPAELVCRVGTLANGEKVKPFAIFLSAFIVLLSRYSSQDDLIIGAAQQASSQPGSGLFENVLIVRCDLANDPIFRDVVQRIDSAINESEAHSLPFSVLLESLQVDEQVGINPFFQVLFLERAAESASASDVSSWPQGTSRLDLAAMIHKHGESVCATFRYDSKLFEAPTIARLAANYVVLLDHAIANSSADISLLPILSEAERHQLLVKWNDTAVAYPTNIPIHRLIEQQVERTPDAAAVIFESTQLTYRELNQRSNQLAHRLRNLGVGPDVLVAVCTERSLEMVIALLGTLKAGGAYTPFDPEYPQQRLLAMLQDADPPVILTQSHLADRLPPTRATVICLDKDCSEGQSKDNPSLDLTGKNLAYCIYTSGSTGRPKGVPNTHEAIVNRILWGQDKFRLTTTDRYLQKTPYSFDVSVPEFFWPLMTGATLVMAKPGGHKDPAYLAKIIQDRGITTLHFVPSMLALFLETEGLEHCTSVRQVFSSGEALPLELQSRFFSRFRASLHNLYGPTEAAVEVTHWECKRDMQRSIVPIGRPIANTQIYVLDRHLQPVPIGAMGELHIGGIQLARGYLNLPQATAEKFIPDPFRQSAGARLYKTGDLARVLSDGNVEYLGRTDHQVKLRGFRIELGEIEAVLTQAPGVSQAAVIVREDVPGNQQLVAYVTPSSHQEISLENVRGSLSEKLPAYMIPASFVVLDRLPMTTSGKVDRRALPAPMRTASRELVAASGELETKVIHLFEKILGIRPLGVTDDFFEMGGHSLLAARLLAEIRQATGRALPLSAMLQASSARSIARIVAGEDEATADSTVVQIQAGEMGRPPLFAVVVPGVETVGYAALARHVGPQQAVYKLQAKGPIPGKRPFTAREIQDLASEYIAAMRSIQSQGPYCLIGMCDDVQVCERIIVQLEQAGQEVAFFAVLDTWVLQNSMVRWKWKLDYYRTRLRQLASSGRSRMLENGLQVLGRKIDRSRRFEESNTTLSWDQVYWPVAGFQPPVFQAPIVLFKRPRQPFYYVKDREMGWGQRTKSGVEIHEIEMDHENLLREPHVKVIAKILARTLEKASRQTQDMPAAGHLI
jgi:amino acid adenylation domain-containing protein